MEQNSIQDRVTAICNDLYSKGTKPSVRIVLSMLPDVSSTSTVHKYFANWKKELEANQQSLYDRLGFSSEFTQSFMKEITRFGVEAEQRYKEQSIDANEQRDIAVEELEKTEDKLFKQNAVIDQQAKEIKELQLEMVKVQEKLKAELVTEQQANKAVVTELRQQLDDIATDNKTLTSSNENLRTEIAKAELKLESNQEYVNEVKTQNANLVADNKELNTNIASLSKTIASQESTIAGNEKLIDNLQKSSIADKEASQKLEKVFEQYRTETTITTNDLRSENESLSAELEQTGSKLHKANEQIVTLQKTNEEQSSVIKKLTESETKNEK